MNDVTSTARRRELGAELRRIREQRGFNGLDMAARLRWTASMVSRAETGKRAMSQLEVATYIALCGVAGQQLDELLALAAEPDTYRLKPHHGEISDALRTLIFHETTANEITSYQPIYIPGVAQTEDYARAIIHEIGVDDPLVIEDFVRIRMSRRIVLTRLNPAICTFYVHENALRAPIGSPQVMYEQMLHLLFLSSRPQCSIRVVPVSAGARGMAEGSFQTFGYPDGSPVVCVQHDTTSEFLENKEELAGYGGILERVASVALDDTRSREFIVGVAGDYERLGAAPDGHGVGGSAGLAQE